MTNRPQEAIDCASQALQLSLEHKERGVQAYTLGLLGEIAMHHDPPDIGQAETHDQQSLTLANELGMRPLQAHCHLSLGTLYSQTGQVDQAHSELSIALNLYRSLEMTYWLPQGEAALAEVENR